MMYGRSVRRIMIVWLIAFGSFGLLYSFDVSAPAFHELLIPFYWIILGITGFLSWRWVRSRSMADRRGRDRRKSTRRGDYESAQAADPDREEK